MRNLEKKLNERIRAILKDKGLNQRELCDRADMDTGYLSMLLNLTHDKRWNLEQVEKIVRGLNVPAWQLFVDPKEVLPKEYLEWRAGYEVMDPDNKRIVDAMIEAAKAKKGDGDSHTPKKSRSGM